MLFASSPLADASESAHAVGTAGRLLLILLGGGLLAFLFGVVALRIARHAASPGRGRRPVRRSKRLSAWEEAGRRLDTPSASPRTDSKPDDGPGPWGAP